MCDGHTSGDFGCQKCAKSILERKHGWIECKSTSFPGKIYYFHTVTRCSTWQRPVPRDTKLPRYKKLRDSRSFESPMDDQILPSPLGVSETESSFFSSENPPSDFELHARRMQIYLQKNTNYNLSMKYVYGRSDIILRDKLFECYKKAKSELAKNLKQKKKPTETTKTVKVSNVKPKTRLMDPVKTIRECHGIKTISYDPIPPELPNGADKMPDLSETSIDSLTPIQGFEKSDIIDDNNSRRQGHAREVIAGHNKNFAQSLVFKDLNLSESETTENYSAVPFFSHS